METVVEMKFGRSSLRKIAAVALLILVFSFSGCMRSPQEKSARFLAAGKRLLQNKDPRRAILQFHNAIQVYPSNAETYYQLGIAFFEVQDYRQAVIAFLKALEINPSHAGARLRIAQMKSDTNNRALVEDAEREVKALMQDTGANSEILNTLALTELKLGNSGNAVQSLERALTEFPPDLRSFVILAHAKLDQKDTPGAEEILKKACKDLPKSADAHRILAEFYLSQIRSSDAEPELQRALSLDPKSGPALYDLAQLQLREGRKQEAEQSFKRLAGFEGYGSIYAVFLFKDGRQDQALSEFERLAKEAPDDRQARTNLIVAYRTVHRPADADRLLSAALKKNPKDLDALLQRGEIGIERRDFSQAEADLNSVLAAKPDPEVYYLLAKLNQARGNVLLYRQNLSEALRLNPKLLTVRVELAGSLVATKAGAQAALDYLNQAPDVIPVMVVRNWAHWMLDDLARMRKGIDQGLAQQRSVDLLIQDGLWKLRSGDPAGARTSVIEALKIDPTDIRALQALQQTYLSQKNDALALQKVKEYAAQQPKSAPVQDFLAMLLMAKGEKTQARSVLASVKSVDPQFVLADLSLVQLDYADHNLADARKRLEALLARDNANTTAQIWLAIVEEHMGDYNNAIENLRKALDLAPNDAQASNNLAYLLTENRNEPDSALKYAQRAVELQPSAPAFRDTLGWVLYRKGQYAQAIQHLEIAGARPDNVVWKYHLAMAYAKDGDVARSRATLEAALKLNPNVPEAKAARQLVDALH